MIINKKLLDGASFSDSSINNNSSSSSSSTDSSTESSADSSTDSSTDSSSDSNGYSSSSSTGTSGSTGSDDQTESDRVAEMLTNFLKQFATMNKLASTNVNFMPEAEAEVFRQSGYDLRETVQYRWENINPVTNKSFESFDDYLGCFKSKRRIKIKGERRRVYQDHVTYSTNQPTNQPTYLPTYQPTCLPS